MSGFHFIMQTSKCLLINATAVTLGQGHGKVIQYISPDLYIVCSKYLRFSSKGFDVRGKSCCGGGRQNHFCVLSLTVPAVLRKLIRLLGELQDGRRTAGNTSSGPWTPAWNHLHLDKMAAISQTICSDAFSWMKSFVFWLQFHWSLFLRAQLTITQNWFR